MSEKIPCKLILTDLDHTLLRSDGSVSEHTLDVLTECRRKGVKLAIATARYWIGAEKYINLLKPDYEITTDGALIHAEEECIYSCSFSVDETNRLLQEIFAVKPGAEVTVASGKTVLWNSLHIAESARLHKAVYCDFKELLTCRANKLAVEFEKKEYAEKIAEKMDCKLQCFRNENWYAFLPKEAGKVQAIEALSKWSGISISDIVAFGDDQNDIGMLRTCGTGVAVRNAIPAVKEVCDYVTGTNDEDGVASFLQQRCVLLEERDTFLSFGDKLVGIGEKEKDDLLFTK